jgi:hypothetical protein
MRRTWAETGVDACVVVQRFFNPTPQDNPMKTIQSSLLTIPLIFAAIDIAHAAQTPNSYDCVGKNVHATLNIGTSKSGASILPTQTTLNLELGKKSYSYSDADITQESTLIGDLWEVTVKIAPDVYVDHATLVVPPVLVDTASLQFDSRLILTHVSTPFIAIPAPGVINSSRYIPVKCSASMLYY